MSWSQRRKAIYSVSFLSVLLLVFLIIFLLFFNNKKPTCFDSIKNGNETGVDCGGSCVILCRADYANPSIVWVRWAKVLSSGSYNLLAYGENPNLNAGALNVPYHYKIYDNKNILLYENSGFTYVPSENNFVIFEDGIHIGDKVPARVDFQFLTQNISWQKIQNLELGIKTISQTLINEDTRPKLLATIQNTTLKPMQNIQSVAILYDQNDNAIAFSKTKIDLLDKNSTTDIVFTWPETFQSKVYKIEIVSEILPK